MKHSATSIAALKTTHTPIVALTCYDFPTATWADRAGLDLLLVGDSVGTNVLGYASEKEVTLNDIAHHLRAVRRGTSTAYILADLPYGTADTVPDALRHARSLIAAGADGVKLEGHKPEIIAKLTESGIDVVAHLGLMPQIHTRKGLMAKRAESAARLLEQACQLEAAGAWALVLELIPEEVGREVTARLTIPTIGIGAGRHTDGQVLIVQDVLGVHELDFRHNQRFATLGQQAIAGLHDYCRAVRGRQFPSDAHVRHLAGDEWRRFSDHLHDLDGRD